MGTFCQLCSRAVDRPHPACQWSTCFHVGGIRRCSSDADAFGHLTEGLCETNHTAVLVPAVDEIIKDALSAALTDQLIKDNNLLAVNWQLFECRDFIPLSLNGFIAHLRVGICGKALQQSQVFFVGKCSLEKRYTLSNSSNLYSTCSRMLVNFARVARPANQHA